MPYTIDVEGVGEVEVSDDLTPLQAAEQLHQKFFRQPTTVTASSALQAPSVGQPESTQSINTFFSQAAVDSQDSPNMAGAKGAWESLITPQVNINRVQGSPDDPFIDKVSGGLYNATAGLLEFFTSPIGIATAGLSALPAGVAKVAGGSFAVDLSRHLPEVAAGIGTALGEGDVQKATELTASAAVQLAAIRGGAKHAIGEGIPVRPPARPTTGLEGEPLIQPPPIERAVDPRVRLQEIQDERGPEYEPIWENGQIVGSQLRRKLTPEEKELLKRKADEDKIEMDTGAGVDTKTASKPTTTGTVEGVDSPAADAAVSQASQAKTIKPGDRVPKEVTDSEGFKDSGDAADFVNRLPAGSQVTRFDGSIFTKNRDGTWTHDKSIPEPGNSAINQGTLGDAGALQNGKVRRVGPEVAPVAPEAAKPIKLTPVLADSQGKEVSAGSSHDDALSRAGLSEEAVKAHGAPEGSGRAYRLEDGTIISAEKAAEMLGRTGRLRSQDIPEINRGFELQEAGTAVAAHNRDPSGVTPDPAPTPIKAYHFTTEAPFEKFDPARIGTSVGHSDPVAGFYLTTNSKYKGNIPEGMEGDFNRMDAEITLKNPLRLKSYDDVQKWGDSGEVARKSIEASGYDGVIFANGDEIVAFHPEQVTFKKPTRATTPEPAPVEPPKAEVRAESAEERLGNIVNETIDQSNNAQKLGIRPGASSRSTDVVLGAPDLKSVSPKVEARWQAAVKEKPSVLDRIKVGAENAWKSVTREYADLPPRQYPQEIDILRRLRASPNASARQAADVLRGITINLGPKQYGVFSRVLALEDLVKDVESGKYGQGKELPFGYENADTLNADLAKFKAIADATPQITDALSKRRDFNDALKNTLVERGFLPKEVLNDPRYFHHQVLLYLAEKGGSGGPKSFRDWFSGWQKKRTGSALDYNRQYVEAEAEVVADAFKKIRMQDFQAEMKQASDLKPSLVELHGKEWKQHIPKTHTLWQPKKGNAFYPARTVAEKVMDQYLEGLRDILPEDFREALVVGGKRQEWVIPKELSKVLDNLAPRNESWIERFAESANSAWKKYILLMPLRAIKYMVNNVSGDVDFMFAANPKIFKEFKQAASDSWGFHEKGKAATGDIKEAVDMGVMGSGFRASELADISRNDYFNWLTGEKPGLIDRWWNGISKLNDAREDIGRLATYRFALKELNAGRKFYGASVPRDIDALPTNKLKAAKVARELLIDYGRETEFGEYARRKVVPFYRWMHGNFARYIQLIKNIPEQEGAAGAGARLATVAGTKLAARMAFAYAAVNMWNHLIFPKEEEELGEGRNQLHLILGRDDQGNIQTLRFQGALSDLLGWVGGENLPQDIEDIAKGTASVGDKMEEAGEAAVSKAVNSSFPFVKTGAEALMQRSLYPNALKPSPVRDRGEHVAGLFSLKNVYKWIAGKPHKPFRQEISSLIAYTTDPGEAAYNATRHMAGEWLEDKGEDKGSFIPSKRSNALYYHKQALRYKDQKMAEKFLAEYKKLGGTGSGLNRSIEASEPLKMLGKRKKEFLDSLSPQELATVQRAEDWYDRVLK